MKVSQDFRKPVNRISSKMNYFIYTSHHFTPDGRYALNKLTSLPMCGFIAQLVEQRTGNAEVTGSNPVEALIFFRLLLSNCLNWKIYCDDHSSLSICPKCTKPTTVTTLNGTNLCHNELRDFHMKFSVNFTNSFQSSRFD